MEPIVITSHPRSGTHLLIDTLLNNLAGYTHYRDVEAITLRDTPRDLRGCILKSHAAPAWGNFSPAARGWLAEMLAGARVIYIYRDGRDVLTSLYYMERSHLPERTPAFPTFLRGHGAHWPALEAGDAVDRPTYWSRHVEGWLAHPGVATVAYEALLTDFDATFRRIVAAVGGTARPDPAPAKLPLGPVQRLLRRSLRAQFDQADRVRHDLLLRLAEFDDRTLRRRLAGGAPSTAVFPRQGKIGGWRARFDDADEAFFLERAGPTMRRLGYLPPAPGMR